MRITAYSSHYDLEGVCADDADLDDAFEMLTDDGERLMVNGWLFSIERED